MYVRSCLFWSLFKTTFTQRERETMHRDCVRRRICVRDAAVNLTNLFYDWIVARYLSTVNFKLAIITGRIHLESCLHRHGYLKTSYSVQIF